MSHNKESYRRWYDKNKEKKRLAAREWERNNPDKVKLYRSSKKVRDKNKKKLSELKIQWHKKIDEIKLHYGCQNNLCLMRSIGYISAELDFHHLNCAEKSHTIGELVNRRKSLVVLEINKCCVLCSNCHRRHHSGVSLELIGKCNINDELTPV